MNPSRQSNAARRRAAAAAIASVGAGILGTPSAEAGIVTIDLANVNGVNFTGVNAGVASGAEKDWLISFGTAGTLRFGVQNAYNSGYTGIHLRGDGGTLNQGGVANGGAYCTPSLYALGAPIGGSASNFANSNFGGNALFKYTGGNAIAPNFDGYLGFLSSGTDGFGNGGVYGWIKATWDGTNFQFYSAAYESTPGLAIHAGDTGIAPVPEIDPSGLASTMSLVIGSAAMLEQRRRKRAAVAVTAAVTA